MNNKNIQKFAKSAIAASILALPMLSAHAATETAQINVSATVNHSCTFAANNVDLSFGALSDMSADASANTTLSVACTNGLPFQLGFNLGQNADGGNRRLKTGSTSHITYRLFDATAPLGSPELGMNWGINTLSGVGAGLSATNYQPFNLEGVVPSQAVADAGNYTDTILVTLQY